MTASEPEAVTSARNLFQGILDVDAHIRDLTADDQVWRLREAVRDLAAANEWLSHDDAGSHLERACSKHADLIAQCRAGGENV